MTTVISNPVATFRGFGNLPLEILLEIFEQCDYKTLKSALHVCRTFNAVINSPSSINSKFDRILFREKPAEEGKNELPILHPILVSLGKRHARVLENVEWEKVKFGAGRRLCYPKPPNISFVGVYTLEMVHEIPQVPHISIDGDMFSEDLGAYEPYFRMMGELCAALLRSMLAGSRVWEESVTSPPVVRLGIRTTHHYDFYICSSNTGGVNIADYIALEMYKNEIAWSGPPLKGWPLEGNVIWGWMRFCLKHAGYKREDVTQEHKKKFDKWAEDTKVLERVQWGSEGRWYHHHSKGCVL